MKKRIPSLLLCLVLCFGLLPGSTLPQDDSTASTELVLTGPEMVISSAEDTALDGTEGPQPAQENFTVNLVIVAPDGTDTTGAIVRKDRTNSGDIVDFAGSPAYSSGDSVNINAGEWALFGYKEIEGLYASWSGSTMGNGLYAVADTPTSGSVTLTLTYSTEAPTGPNGPGPGEGGGPGGPSVADKDFSLAVSISYPEGYTGEKNGALQRVNENREPISGEVYKDGDTVSIRRGELAMFTYVKLAAFEQTTMIYSGSGSDETINGVQYIRAVGTGPDGKASITVAYGQSGGPGGPGEGEGGPGEGDGPGEGEGGPSGPQPAQENFTVNLVIAAPKGTDTSAAIVRKDRTNNGDIVDFAGSPAYSSGDSVNINAGEWALFGYKEIEGLYASWSGSTMGNGLYAIADAPTGGSATLTLTYSTEAPTGPNGPGEGPGSGEGGGPGEDSGANYYDVRLDGHSDVGMYSANINMTWWAPSTNVQNDYRLFITYGTTPDLLYTDGGLELGGGAADAKTRSYSLGDLMPNTVYYYQVYMLVGDAGEYEIKNGQPYSDGSATIIYGTTDGKPGTFTTASGPAAPCYEVSIPAGSADSGNTEVLCLAKDPSGVEAVMPLSFHQPHPNDVLNHDGELRFTVSEDGLYCLRPVHTPDGPGTSSTGPYDMAEAVNLTISGVNESGNLVYTDQLTRFFCEYNGFLAGASVNLKKGITYTVKLDSGGGTTQLSVLRIYENNVNFTADLSVEQSTRDNRVWRTVAKVEYAADATFYHGLRFDVRYDTKEHYEQTGELRWTYIDRETGTYQPGPAATSGYTYFTLGRVVPGVEYVCQVKIYRVNTSANNNNNNNNSSSEPAAELCSDLVYYTGANDHPLILSMGENLNYENKPQVLAEMADYTYNFYAPETGYYLFNLNKLGATLELYDKDGQLLATGADGSLGSRGWTSVTAFLEGEQTYYLYISGLNTTVPIVTINRIEGKAEPEDDLIELPEGSEDTARDCLDRTINDLTKTGTGEDAPLPDYVDTDAAGEEALRQAIEHGDPMAAEIQGKTLDEEDVDPEVLDAMTQEAEQELTNCQSIVFLELSVDLTLDGEGICQITELEEELEFIFSLTEEQQTQYRGKQLHVARCHGDGEVELIPCEFRDNGRQICFRTNKFSTFGLYASDAPASNGGDQVVKTGDNRQPALWALALVSLGAAMSILLPGKKRRS